MANKNLMAGFTTIRDLGSEGAGYADVGIKQSIELGIIDGPRMLVAGRAMVATGSYGPKGFHPDFDVPLGAETADSDNVIKVTRDQIGKGADFIKIYADYRWGPNGESLPTFSIDEMTLIVETARSSGRDVVAHANSADAIKRAVTAGVTTIEHGTEATQEVLKLMKERDVGLCPTLAATESIAKYRGWRKGIDDEPDMIVEKKKMFLMALDAGVKIIAGVVSEQARSSEPLPKFVFFMDSRLDATQHSAEFGVAKEELAREWLIIAGAAGVVCLFIGMRGRRRRAQLSE